MINYSNQFLIKKIRYYTLTFLFSTSFLFPAFCQSAERFDFERIEDNSFLIEEAYNQEANIIQHISTFQFIRDNNWVYTFTDEWPVPDQKNQLSATIPVLSKGEPGFGDIALNYRYQAFLKTRFAFSPRFSLLLPTGNYKTGLGSGTVGYQINLPVSYLLSPLIATHYNLGLTFTPGAKNEDGSKAEMTTINYGLSMILLLKSNFNFMLEIAGNTTTLKGTNLANVGSNTIVVNPGIRYAFNFKSGLQIVPGIAMPIVLGGQKSLFAYLSFEHKLRKQ
jgi:hypothetical protein